MTQLVELQQVLPELHAAGYRPYAISNDTVERLADFAGRNGITYSLLSDEDSAVIKRFGIMNTLIQPGEGKHMRWYGIPYPGTYITDSAGLIVRKEFHQHHARRASGRTLLYLATGIEPDIDTDAVDVRATVEGSVVNLDAALLDPTLRLEVLSTLVCRVRVADGFHLYAAGAPDAFMPATLTVEGAGIRVGAPSWPEPHRLDMPLMGGEAVPVWEGDVTVTIPVTATSDLIRLGHGLDVSEAVLDLRLNFQACNDDTCMMPDHLQTRLTVPLATLVEPEGIKTYVDRAPTDPTSP
jgi:peroxiredoxin